MASDPEPLWLALRAALKDRDYTVRGFAKLCHEEDPRMTWDSWLRTLRRALKEDSTYTPSPDTAHLWARLLKKPKNHFVRPQQRVALKEEVERLREENRRLRAQLARRRERS